MALPFALIAAGASLQIVGGMKSLMDQADAERANASFYREQAEYYGKAAARSEAIFERQAARQFGSAVGAAIKSGVDISSFTSTLSGIKSAMTDERNAIRAEGEFRQRLALLRAAQADRTADSLSSPLAMASTVVGPLLTAGAAL